MKVFIFTLLLFYFSVVNGSVIKFGVLTTTNSPVDMVSFIERYIENINSSSSMSIYSYELIKKQLTVTNNKIETSDINTAINSMKDTVAIFGYVSESLDVLENALSTNNLYFWNAKPNNYECYENMFFSINKCSTIIQSLRYINGNYSSILLFVENTYESIDCIDNIMITLKNVRNDYSRVDITSLTPSTDIETKIKEIVKEDSKTAIVALVGSAALGNINSAYATVATTETWLKPEKYPIISFYLHNYVQEDHINIQQFQSIESGIINELYTKPAVTPAVTMTFDLLSTYVLMDMFFTQAIEYHVFNIQMFLNSISFYHRSIVLDDTKRKLTTKISPNHIIDSEIEIYRKDSTNDDKYITNFILPKDYNYQYTIGLPIETNKICHILAKKYSLDMNLKYVIIISYLTGSFKDLDKGTLEGFLSAINEINLIDDSEFNLIIPIIIDGGQEMNEVIKQTSEIIQTYNSYYIFTSYEIYDITTLSDGLSKIPELEYYIYYIISSPNEVCTPHLIGCGIPASALIQQIYETFVRKQSLVYIIYSYHDYSNELKDILVSKIDEVSAINYLDYELDDETTGPSLNVCNNIRRECPIDKGGCMIIDLTEREFINSILYAYNFYGFNSTYYPMLSINLEEDSLDEFDIKNFTGEYSFGYFFDSMTESEDQTIRADLQNIYYHGKVTSLVALAYSSIYIWYNSYEVINKNDPQLFRKVATPSSYIGPGGRIYLTNEGICGMQVHIATITKDGLEEYIHQYALISSQSYLKEKKTCDWYNGIAVDITTFTIVFIYPATGDLAKISEDYISVYSTVCDFMNAIGGFAGRMIRPTYPIFDYEDIDKYLQQVESFAKTTADVFVGTMSNKERDLIKHILVKYDKLLLVVNPWEGNQYHDNIVYFGRYPQLYTTPILIQSFMKRNKCLVFSSLNDHFYNTSLYVFDATKQFKLANCSYYLINKTEDLSEVLHVYFNEVNLTVNEKEEWYYIYTFLDNGLSFETGSILLKNEMTKYFRIISFDLVEYEVRKYLLDKEINGLEQYFVSSYLFSSETPTNDLLKTMISYKHGEPNMLVAEPTVTLHAALNFLGSAYANSQTMETAELIKTMLALNIPITNEATYVSNYHTIGQYYYVAKFGTFLEEIQSYSNVIIDPLEEYDSDDYITFGLLIHQDNSDDLSIYGLLTALKDKTNFDGGVLGKYIHLELFYCPETSEELEKLKSDTSEIDIYINLCENKTIYELANDTKMLNLFNNDQEDCNKNLISTYPSPAQLGTPMLIYLLQEYTTKVAIFTMESLKESNLAKFLRNSLPLFGGSLENELFVKSEDDEVSLTEIREYVYSLPRVSPTGGFLINNLKGKAYQEVYKALYDVYNSSIGDSIAISNHILIVSFDQELFKTVPVKYAQGHYVITPYFVDQMDSITNMFETILDYTFSTDYDFKEQDVITYVMYDVLLDLIRNNALESDDNYKQFIITNSFANTVIGMIKLSTDNYFELPMFALTQNKDGVLIKDVQLSYIWDSYFYQRSSYIASGNEEDICVIFDGTGLNVEKSQIIVIILPLEGTFRNEARDVFLGYIAGVDYVNSNMIGGLYLIANFISIPSENYIDILNETLQTVEEKYHTNLIFGLYGSEMRRSILDEIEENNLLLFYPYDYEGQECSSNVVYVGQVFTSQTMFVPFMLDRFGRNYIILYTSSYENQKMVEAVTRLLKNREISIIQTISISLLNSDLSAIVKKVSDLMANGVIISFLQGDSKLLLFKELYQKSMLPPQYYIFSYYFDDTDLFNREYHKYFDGHYVYSSTTHDLILINEQSTFIRNKYAFVTSWTRNKQLAILSVKLIYSAFSNYVNISQYTGKTNQIPRQDLMESLSLSDLTGTISGNVTFQHNNHIALNIYYSKLSYNTSTNEVDMILDYDSKITIKPSPWFKQPSETDYIYCNWNPNFGKVGSINTVQVIRFALFFDLSGRFRQLHSTAIDAACAALIVFSLNHSESYYYDYILYNTQDTADLTRKYALESISDKSKNVRVWIGGDSTNTRKALQELVNNTDIVYFYPKQYQGQDCERYTFYTGTTPDQYAEPLITYLINNQNLKEVYIIGNSNDYSTILKEIITNSFNDVVTIKSNQLVDEISGITLAVAKDTLDKMPNGGIIISTMKDNLALEYIQNLQYILSNSTLFSIYLLRVERTILNDLVLNNNYLNIYLVGSYYDEIQQANSEFASSIYTYSGTSKNTMLSESVYNSIKLYDMATLALNKSVVTSLEFSKAMHGVSFETGSGNVKFLNNNHISAPFYIMKHNNGSSVLTVVYSQTTPIESNPWNWNIPETDGKICDWEDLSIGRIGISNYIKLLVLISLNGYNSDTDNGVSDAINVAVDEINSKYGGYYNNKIVVTLIDYGSDDTTCGATIVSALNSDIKAVFTTASSVCLDMIKDRLYVYDILLFYISYSSGESCNTNIIYISKEPSIFNRVFNYLYDVTDSTTLNYAVFATTDAYSASYLEYITSFISNKGGNLIYSTQIPIESTDIDTLVSNLLTRTSVGCYILYIGPPRFHILLDSSLRRLATNPNIYKIVSLTTSSNVLSSVSLPYYSAQSYFTSLDNSVNTDFLNAVKTKSDSVATEIMTYAYTAVLMWYKAASTQNSFNSTLIKNYLYNNEISSPSGNIKLDNSNYVSHHFYLGKFTPSTQQFLMIDESSSYVQAEVYKSYINDGFYTCELSNIIYNDNSVLNNGNVDLSTITENKIIYGGDGIKTKSTSIIIGIVISFSGIYAEIERGMLNSIEIAVNGINKIGGVMSKMIQIEVVDAKSNSENYVKYVRDFGKRDDIEMIICGSSSVILTEIGPICERYEKLCFYPGISTVNICYPYVIGTQLNVPQFTEAVLRFLTPAAIVTIVDASEEAAIYNTALISLTDMFNVPLIGTFNISNEEEFDNSLNTSFVKGVTILNFVEKENQPKIFKKFCNLKIYGPEFSVISLTLDRYSMIGIDEKCFNSSYMITSFIKELGISSSSSFESDALEFVSSYIENYGKDAIISATQEASYTAIELWYEVVQLVNSFSTEQVRNVIYSYKLRSPGGLLEVKTNGYSSRVMYFVQVLDNYNLVVKNVISTPVSAKAYNEWDTSLVGIICDWTVNKNYYMPVSLTIIFVHYFYSQNSQLSEIDLTRAERYLVDDLNTNYVNGFQVIPIFLFTNNLTKIYEDVNNYLINKEISLVIGCNTIECRDMLEPLMSQHGNILMYRGEDYGNYCSRNILNLYATPNQRIVTFFDYYYTSEGFNRYYFIGDDSDEQEMELRLLKNYMNEMYGLYLIGESTLSSSASNSEITVLQNTLFSYLDTNKLIIFVYLKGEILTRFLTQYTQSSFTTQNFLLNIVYYNPYDVPTDLSNELSGNQIITSYNPSIVTGLSQSYVTTITDAMGLDVYISPELELISIALDLWKSAFVTSASDSGSEIPPFNYFQLCLVGQSLSSPSGNILVEETNYISRNMYIFEISSVSVNGGKLSQSYPNKGQSIIINAYPYGYKVNIPNECKFGKELVYFTYNNAIQVVCYLLFGISLICCIASLVFTIIHHEHKVIRSFGRAFSFSYCVQLFLLSFSMIFLVSYPNENNGICMWRVIYLAFFSKGLFALIFVKCLCLYRLHTRRNHDILKVHITITRLLSYYIIFIVVEIILLLLWGFIDPNKFEDTTSVKFSSYFVESHVRQCSYSIPFLVIELVIDYLILIISFYMSWKTKSVANEFYESTGLFLSCIIILLLGTIIVAIDFTVSSEPDSAALLRTMGVEIIVIFLCICQYGFKFISLYTNESASMNTKSGSQTKLSQAAAVASSRSTTNGGPASLFISTNARLTTRMMTATQNTALN